MASNPHPRIFAQGTQAVAKTAIRAVVYAPVAERAAWIQRELRDQDVVLQPLRTVPQIVAALVDDPAPRPQLLVVDFNSLTAAEILELHSIRDRGWCGTIFAIGRVSLAFRRSLGIDKVMGSLIEDALRVAVSEVGFDAQTRRIPVFGER